MWLVYCCYFGLRIIHLVKNLNETLGPFAHLRILLDVIKGVKLCVHMPGALLQTYIINDDVFLLLWNIKETGTRRAVRAYFVSLMCGPLCRVIWIIGHGKGIYTQYRIIQWMAC